MKYILNNMKDINLDYMSVANEFNNKVKEQAHTVCAKMQLLGLTTYRGGYSINEGHLSVSEPGSYKDLEIISHSTYHMYPASYEKKLIFLKESDNIIKELNDIIKARMAEMTNACE